MVIPVHCLVVLLHLSRDVGRKNRLQPLSGTAANDPSVSGGYRASKARGELRGSQGKAFVPSHGSILPRENKNAMRKNKACDQIRIAYLVAVNQPNQPMKTEIRNFLKMLTDKAAENVAAGMSKEAAVNAVLNRLEAEHPSLVAKLKEVLA
jgi:predicted AAA+ superfamily ATPase